MHMLPFVMGLKLHFQGKGGMDLGTCSSKVFFAGFLLLFLSNFYSINAQPRVSSVEFRGLDRTRAEYLISFLQVKRGDLFDADQVAIDEQTLHNLQLFAAVGSRVVRDNDNVAIIYELTERVTRIPITNFGGIKDNFWFQIGVTDYNWLGRGAHFGGYYQHYDRHSFKLFQQLPHLFSQRWGVSYIVGRQATREPAYFLEGTSEFDVDRWEVTGLLRYQIFRNLNRHESLILEFGGGYLNELYEQRSASPIEYSGETRFDKYFAKTLLTYQRLNYFFHHISGIAQQLSLQRVETAGLNDTFWKVLSKTRLYKRLGRRVNPALRVRMGISSNDDSPFVPFVLDSYLNVRGSGNRVARGTSEFTINLEYRHTFFERPMWAAQAVAFIDMSAWRPAGAPLADMFLTENVVSFGGGGFRLHFRRIYNFTLRIDYGINTSDVSSRGFVLGVGQYF